MSHQQWATVLVGLFALLSALYTASQSRSSANQSAQVADKDSERDAQIDLLKVLSEEVDKANARIVALRERLASTEDMADAERTKRREMQRQLEVTVWQVEQLNAMMAAIPALAEYPEVARLVDAMLRRPAQGPQGSNAG